MLHLYYFSYTLLSSIVLTTPPLRRNNETFPHVFLLVTLTCPIQSKERPLKPNESKINILTYDAKKRVSLAEIKTYYGVCLGEVIYDQSPYPEIHVVVISEKKLQNIGHMKLRHTTEKKVTHAELMRVMRKIRDEACLPNIIPGYEKI
jgi:hypothetical protein